MPHLCYPSQVNQAVWSKSKMPNSPLMSSAPSSSSDSGSNSLSESEGCNQMCSPGPSGKILRAAAKDAYEEYGASEKRDSTPD